MNEPQIGETISASDFDRIYGGSATAAMEEPKVGETISGDEFDRIYNAKPTPQPSPEPTPTPAPVAPSPQPQSQKILNQLRGLPGMTPELRAAMPKDTIAPRLDDHHGAAYESLMVGGPRDIAPMSIRELAQRYEDEKTPVIGDRARGIRQHGGTVAPDIAADVKKVAGGTPADQIVQPASAPISPERMKELTTEIPEKSHLEISPYASSPFAAHRVVDALGKPASVSNAGYMNPIDVRPRPMDFDLPDNSWTDAFKRLALDTPSAMGPRIAGATIGSAAGPVGSAGGMVAGGMVANVVSEIRRMNVERIRNNEPILDLEEGIHAVMASPEAKARLGIGGYGDLVFGLGGSAISGAGGGRIAQMVGQGALGVGVGAGQAVIEGEPVGKSTAIMGGLGAIMGGIHGAKPEVPPVQEKFQFVRPEAGAPPEPPMVNPTFRPETAGEPMGEPAPEEQKPPSPIAPQPEQPRAMPFGPRVEPPQPQAATLPQAGAETARSVAPEAAPVNLEGKEEQAHATPAGQEEPQDQLSGVRGGDDLRPDAGEGGQGGGGSPADRGGSLQRTQGGGPGAEEKPGGPISEGKVRRGPLGAKLPKEPKPRVLKNVASVLNDFTKNGKRKIVVNKATVQKGELAHFWTSLPQVLKNKWFTIKGEQQAQKGFLGGTAAQSGGSTMGELAQHLFEHGFLNDVAEHGAGTKVDENNAMEFLNNNPDVLTHETNAHFDARNAGEPSDYDIADNELMSAKREGRALTPQEYISLRKDMGFEAGDAEVNVGDIPDGTVVQIAGNKFEVQSDLETGEVKLKDHVDIKVGPEETLTLDKKPKIEAQKSDEPSIFETRQDKIEPSSKPSRAEQSDFTMGRGKETPEGFSQPKTGANTEAHPDTPDFFKPSEPTKNEALAAKKEARAAEPKVSMRQLFGGEKKSQIIPYSPDDPPIKNIDALPRGTGARYLEVIKGENGELVAKQWRKKPVDGATVIDFKPEAAAGKESAPSSETIPEKGEPQKSPPQAANEPANQTNATQAPEPSGLSVIKSGPEGEGGKAGKFSLTSGLDREGREAKRKQLWDEMGGETKTGVPVDDFKRLVQIAALHVEDGMETVGDWIKAARANNSTASDEDLTKAWDEAKGDGEVKVFSGVPIPEPIKKGYNQLRSAVSLRSMRSTTAVNQPTGEAGTRFGVARDAVPRLAEADVAHVLGDNWKDAKVQKEFGDLITEDQLREKRQAFTDAGDPVSASHVTSTIGGKDSSFKTEAEYKAALKKYAPELNRLKSDIMPKLEQNFVDAATVQGKPPTLHKPSRETGIFFSLAPNINESTGSGTPPKAGVRLLRKFVPLTAKTRTGAGEYKTNFLDMMKNVYEKNYPEAAKKRFLDTAVSEGVAVKEWKAPDEIHGEKPVSIDIARESGATDRYWIPGSLESEFKAVTNPKSYKIPGLTPTLKAANWVSLQGLAEAGFHIVNQIRPLFQSRTPGGIARRVFADTGFMPFKAIDSLSTVYKGIRDYKAGEPEAIKRIAWMAENGALGPAREHSGLSKIGGAAIAKTDIGVRLFLDQVFDKLAKGKPELDTITNRREFINDVGNYSVRTIGEIPRATKQSGFSPFITGGGTAVRGAMRGTFLGGQGIPMGAAGRAGVIFRTAGAPIITAAIIRYALTGKASPPSGVPLTGIAYGNRDEDGKQAYFDLGGGTGFSRAVKSTGIRSLMDKTRGPDEALKDIRASAAHPFMGPGATALSTMLFGISPSVRNLQTAPNVPAGESQIKQNFKSAVSGLNPTIQRIKETKKGDRLKPSNLIRFALPSLQPQEAYENTWDAQEKADRAKNLRYNTQPKYLKEQAPTPK